MVYGCHQEARVEKMAPGRISKLTTNYLPEGKRSAVDRDEIVKTESSVGPKLVGTEEEKDKSYLM